MARKKGGRSGVLVALAAACLGIAALAVDELGISLPGLDGGRESPAAGDSPPTGEAADLLAQLVVAPEGPDDDYDRKLFPHWVTGDDRGCDTRSLVLQEESISLAQVDFPGCVVVAGDWVSPYDGVEVDDPAELDIDHVVPLAEAWRSGAHAWDDDDRRAFANDLDNPGALVAVTATTNRAKGDADPADWRPPDESIWCDYATDWITVKVQWELTVDEDEHAALVEMLATC